MELESLVLSDNYTPEHRALIRGHVNALNTSADIQLIVSPFFSVMQYFATQIVRGKEVVAPLWLVCYSLFDETLLIRAIPYIFCSPLLPP